MSRDDHGSGKRKNPWGNTHGQRPHGSRGGSGGPGGNNDQPDLDEVLRKAQEGLRGILPGNMNGGVAALGLIGVIALLWLASGFYIVNPGEHGVVQRFGKWSRTQTLEGLDYHLPAPVETVTKVNVNSLRKMNIGFTEFAARGRTASKKPMCRRKA